VLNSDKFETLKFLKLILPYIPEKEMLPKVVPEFLNKDEESAWDEVIMKNTNFQVTKQELDEVRAMRAVSRGEGKE
jgi:hypothetical protein